MNLWQWMGAYAALSSGCFLILVLMIPELPDGPRGAPPLGARIIVIAGALVAMAMIVHDLQKRAHADRQSAANAHHIMGREGSTPHRRQLGRSRRA